MNRFITKEYEDGSKISFEWDSIMDGYWPYPDNCKEVIFKIRGNNPMYDENKG